MLHLALDSRQGLAPVAHCNLLTAYSMLWAVFFTGTSTSYLFAPGLSAGRWELRPADRILRVSLFNRGVRSKTNFENAASPYAPYFQKEMEEAMEERNNVVKYIPPEQRMSRDNEAVMKRPAKKQVEVSLSK